MNSELAAMLMGLAAVLLLIGYRIRGKKEWERERERLLAEFQAEEEHTGE